MPTHCCEMMDFDVADEDNVIYFWEKSNEYLIPVHDGGSSGIVVRFCPRCGTRLPDPTAGDDESGEHVPARQDDLVDGDIPVDECVPFALR